MQAGMPLSMLSAGRWAPKAQLMQAVCTHDAAALYPDYNGLNHSFDSGESLEATPSKCEAACAI